MSRVWKFQFFHTLANVGLVSISIVAISISVYWCLIMVKCECATLSDLPLYNHGIGKHHLCKDFGHESSFPWVHSAFRAFGPSAARSTENFPLLIPTTQWLISLLHHFYCLPKEKMLYLLSCFLIYLTYISISPHIGLPHLFKGYIIVHSLKVLCGFKYSLLLWISIVSIFLLLNKCCSCPLLQYI